MKLADYISDSEQRNQLADAVGTSAQYLWQLSIAWRGKRASKVMAQAIERETNGAVTRSDLRPDIWPELSAPKKKAA
ncbi:MAG: helix-turn-helix domain-containing protein [Rudaea sp.]|uniref:transcriptional regulator n=1 Tax=unclassified Rudaea TaxID=2627037 RepID=UPI0010F5CA96|nr:MULTISPECIES: YdaS family helix-turn-helix protein [unclassified Rudaea]MBN8887555.1 helix-turn-helix domain-containing protein [Rudaea sp.]